MLAKSYHVARNDQLAHDLMFQCSHSLRGGDAVEDILVLAQASGTFGLWRVCFPPCVVRPGRRLPVQGLSEGSLGFPGLDRLPGAPW